MVGLDDNTRASATAVRVRVLLTEVLVGVAVFVGSGVLVGVLVGSGVLVGVGEGPVVGVRVGVLVGAGADVFVGVKVAVERGVFVGVWVGVAVGKVPDSNKLKASTSLAPNPTALPSKKSTEEKLQAVTLPSEVGEQTKTSSSNPETPVTAKSPRVER